MLIYKAETVAEFQQLFEWANKEYSPNADIAYFV